MRANRAKVEFSKDYMRGQMAGLGMGIFAICIPFKEVVSTGWPRLATGTLGLILWIYGLSYILSQGRRKAHGPGVETAPTPPPIGPS